MGLGFNDPMSGIYQQNPDLYTNELSGQQILDAGTPAQSDPFASQGQPPAQLPQQQADSSGGANPLGDSYVDPTTGQVHYGPAAIGMPRYSYVPDGKGGFTVAVNPGAITHPADNMNQTVPPGSGAIGTMFPQVVVPPQYFEGDQYKPGGMKPGDVATLQAQMAQAGLYGPQSANSTTPQYVPGVWGPQSIAAYRTLLMSANQSGHDATTTLGTMQQQAAAQAKQQKDLIFRRPITVTNSADIAAAARKIAPDLLGRFLNPDEDRILSKFFQGMQSNDEIKNRQSQVRAYEGKTSNNEVVERPPARGIRTIEDLMRQLHPQDYGAHQMGTAGQTFLRMMGTAPAGFSAPGTTANSSA